MINKIKSGYTLFIKKDNENLIGTLTLKDNDIYKEIIELKDEEMIFISEFSNIYNFLSNERALVIKYDVEKNRFISSINKKVNIGEYNDKFVWNDTFNNSGQDIIESLNHLDEYINDNIERSVLK